MLDSTFTVMGALSKADGVVTREEINAVEQIAREELELFFSKGPRKGELKSIKTQRRADFIRGIETIGGNGSKSAILAENMVYGGNPALYQQELDDYAAATTRDLQRVASKWLDQPPYVAHIVPYPELKAAAAGADRSILPEPRDTHRFCRAGRGCPAPSTAARVGSSSRRAAT